MLFLWILCPPEVARVYPLEVRSDVAITGRAPCIRPPRCSSLKDTYATRILGGCDTSPQALFRWIYPCTLREGQICEMRRIQIGWRDRKNQAPYFYRTIYY